MLELLAAADAEVLSSGWENFPHSLVEGLAVGTPVIATGVGGVREIVTDGENGLLVPPVTPMRSRLRSAASSPTRRCGSGCAPPLPAPSPATRRSRVYARLEALLQEAAA